ncbi:hypothetical protein LINPERPRIM_LOCUS26968 [Linum perenne]
MWERTARKLMLEMDYLKKEHVELSRNQGNLDMELTEACAERDGLRKEIEQLKQLLAKEKMKPPPLDNPSEGTWQMVKELEREISFQKQASGNLTMQLKRSQESNVELVIVLQDLEETLEKQKVEIESLYDMESRFGELEDAMEASTESNKNLMAQVLKLQESEKDLLIKVHELEMALEEGSYGTNSVSNREVESVEMEGRVRELTKELGGEREEVKRLEAGLASKQVENEDLQRYRAGAEARVSVLEKEKEHIELELETVTRENEIASRCLNDLQNDLAMISSNLETHVSANKNLERKSLELERKSYKKLLMQIDSDYNDSVEKVEKLRMELEAEVAELKAELSDRKAEIEILDACLHAKEEEVGQLQRQTRESEAKIFDLKEEKCQLKQNMETIMEENDVAARHLNESQQDIMMLRSSVESHVASNNVLETKCLELEGKKEELDLQSLELKQENEQLATRLSDLEAKMMHLKRERESKEQVLEKFKSEATSLKHEIARLSDEIETDRTNMKNQILLLNNECMAAQEENECVKIEIQKLQTAAESFREEHNSILENNEELRKKSTDLESHCIYLEATLKNTQLSLDEFSKRVMNLEEENECLEEESHKLQAKTEAFREEHNAYMVKNEELGKKNTDLENQCRHLEGKLKNSQLSLDEFSKRVMNLEEKLSSLEQDSASKVKDLTSELDQLHSKYEERAENNSEREFNIEELATFKENQERLESENRRITYQFKDFKSSEAKLRTTINGLELNLTVSNYERNILKEEAKKLKSQLLKLGPVHEQVLALKNELNAVKSDKEKLKSSLNLVSTKCQKLEAVKSSLTEEIAVFHKCVYQLEEHKRQRFALEEKLKNMERDLMAKEAMWERDEQASNELNKIRKTNKQLQMRMDELEDEKDDYAARARSLEEELVMIQEEQLNLSSTNNMDFPNHEYREELWNQHREEKQICYLSAQMCRFKSHSANKSNNSGEATRKPLIKLESIHKESNDYGDSSLERELRDIRERYLQMSLKYAEVEAQREQLVMKLRSSSSGNFDTDF